jgi:L,D-peptidoglycan transpeptidase YkuD (ErfK/YbiS/YcfS/YnhG family)
MAVYDGAKTALKLAADAGALRYQKDQYRNAEKLLREGWLEIAHQKGRLAPFRSYQNADSLLKLASQTARDAQRSTLETIRNLDSLALAERADLAEELRTWRESLDGSLENFQAERHWTSAEFALRQADNLIRKAEFEEASLTLEKGRKELRNMESTIAEYANDEAKKIGVWRQWVHETIEQSKTNGTYALIIDKSAHKAHLVKSGDLVRSYNCELGYNSARQKLFAGDGATPEGTYSVTKVKYASKFHHALLINYPNQTDLRRLRDNKSKGIISHWARAGALIEIHGQGGKNKDWTDGCVALSDRDIDHLMQFASVGMPITIVRRSDLWP